MQLQSIRERLLRLWAGLRCGPLLAIAAACLILEEQYPFSHFPMYSSFSPSTFYVYLADGSGQPLASFATVGQSTATLKKIYRAGLQRQARRQTTSVGKLSEADRRAVAERMLARFREKAAAGTIRALPGALRLYEVQIRQKGEELSKETKLVAELR